MNKLFFAGLFNCQKIVGNSLSIPIDSKISLNPVTNGKIKVHSAIKIQDSVFIEAAPKSEEVHHTTIDGMDVIKVASSPYHHAAITTNGQLYSWGLGNFGQLGHDSLYDVAEPRRISFFEGLRVTDVCCGYFHTLVVVDHCILYSLYGTMYLNGFTYIVYSGLNQDGQLGIPGIQNHLIPVAMEQDFDASDGLVLCCGSNHSIIIDGKTVYRYGSNKYGQLLIGLEAELQDKGKEAVGAVGGQFQSVVVIMEL